VLPDTSLQTASERAESIRLALIAQPIVVAEISIHVTASFGVATYPANGLSPVALIGAADKALYLAKDAGRNQVVAAAPPLS